MTTITPEKTELALEQIQEAPEATLVIPVEDAVVSAPTETIPEPPDNIASSAESTED